MQEHSWPTAPYAIIVVWLIAVGWQLQVVVFELYLKMPELWEQTSAGIGRFPAVKTTV